MHAKEILYISYIEIIELRNDKSSFQSGNVLFIRNLHDQLLMEKNKRIDDYFQFYIRKISIRFFIQDIVSIAFVLYAILFKKRN